MSLTGGERKVAGMQGWEEHTGFWWGNLWKKGHLEEMGVDGRIILEWISQKSAGRGGRGLNGDRWRAVVSTVMKLPAA